MKIKIISNAPQLDENSDIISTIQKSDYENSDIIIDYGNSNIISTIQKSDEYSDIISTTLITDYENSDNTWIIQESYNNHSDLLPIIENTENISNIKESDMGNKEIISTL